MRPALLLVLGFLSSPLAASASFGTLPPGASSTNVLSDVRAEICRDHLFDASRIRTTLPPGYQLLRARDHARDDPGVAALLARLPRYSDYAVGSLCLLSVGQFEVDGVRVHPPGPTPMAFWWARAVGPRDSRMQGKIEWAQLGSYSSGRSSRPAPQASTTVSRRQRSNCG